MTSFITATVIINVSLFSYVIPKANITYESSTMLHYKELYFMHSLLTATTISFHGFYNVYAEIEQRNCRIIFWSNNMALLDCVGGFTGGVE